MDWVEVQAKSVEAAVEVAVEELGLASVEEAEVEVLQEPQRGFLGMGGQDAVVRVRKGRPKRRGRRGRGRGGGQGAQGEQGRRQQQKSQKPHKQQEQKGGGRQGADEDKRGKDRQPSGGKRKSGRDAGGNSGRGGRREGQAKGSKERGGGGQRRQQEAGAKKRSGNGGKDRPRDTQEEAPTVDISEQAQVVEEFIRGLIDAYGLEGTVATEIEEDIIKVSVTGEQTEALVGQKGAIMQAIHELLRIVAQRKTHHRARIRLDIAGYGERRRAALVIYSQRLSEQILDQGGEVMLEPMNPADRKVVHDAMAEIEGVRSWSEGEEPNRSVILGLAPGTEPRKAETGGNGESDEAAGEADHEEHVEYEREVADGDGDDVVNDDSDGDNEDEE